MTVSMEEVFKSGRLDFSRCPVSRNPAERGNLLTKAESGVKVKVLSGESTVKVRLISDTLLHHHIITLGHEEAPA